MELALKQAVVCLCLIVAVACGGGDSSPTSPTPTPTPTPTPVATPAPDLEVSAPSVDDSSPVEGGMFTLSATVRNAGDGESATTTLRFYRSTDGTILTSDTEVGTAAVAGLAAAGSTSASVQLTAPATAGTYDYGACVDAVADESNTANNCSSSVQVTVSEPVATPAPDLEVSAPSVDDSSPVEGGTFTLSATVRNAGDGESATTTLRFYRSTDGTILTSDTEVVAGLAAAGSRVHRCDRAGDGGDVRLAVDAGRVEHGEQLSHRCTVSEPVATPAPDPPSPARLTAFTLSDGAQRGRRGVRCASTVNDFVARGRSQAAGSTSRCN